MRRIKQFMTGMFAALALLLPAVSMVAPASVHAQNVNPELCKGILFTEAGADADNPDCSEEGTEAESAVSRIIRIVIDVFSIVVGAVSVIMIIIGGLRYITSSGDSANVTAAKNTILYAIVGLVIVIFAQTIVKFVVGRITSGAADA